MGSKARHEEAAVSPDGVMSLDEVRRVIAAYEAKYGMSSEEFLRQWEAGTAPDNRETNDWAILLDN